MRVLPKFIAAATIAFFATAAHGGLISGFENGMQGWDSIGDVSVQNSSIGLGPTQGHNFAFLTTLGGSSWDLAPYSGTNSPLSWVTQEFLGIEIGPSSDSNYHERYMVGFPMANPHMLFGRLLPDVWVDYGMAGEGAGVKTQFIVSHSGYISFDWNRLGKDGDNAYFTIWSDKLGSRINGWVYDPHTFADGFTPVDVGLCSHTESLGQGCGIYNAQTGWHTQRVWIGTPGTYSIGFGMNEIDEGTAPTVLALDNVRFNVVPEPSTIVLMVLALTGLAFARRSKA